MNELLEEKIKNAKHELSRAKDSVKLWETMLERFLKLRPKYARKCLACKVELSYHPADEMQEEYYCEKCNCWTY